MLHFMGWHWPAEDREAAHRVSRQFLRLLDAEPRWEMVLNDDGALACILRGRHDRAPVVLHGNSGIIVGQLFQGATPVRAELSELASRRILDSRGEALLSEYWGNYVAILKGPAGSLTLLRGPTSTLPLLLDTDGVVRRFFSSVEVPATLDLIPPAIDWSVLACSLMGPVTSSRTGLRSVSELLPGHAEHVAAHGTEVQAMWKPLDLARQSPVTNSVEAANLVRAAIETCTRALVAGHQRVLHGLSGGLDSSVVLAALNKLPERPDIVCVTYYSEDSEGDERLPARAAMQGKHARHMELRRTEDVDLTRATSGVRTARPPGLRMPEIDRSDSELADALGASVLLKGHGGDEIFCRNLAIPATADCLRGASSRQFLALALHTAVTEGVTFWQVLLEAARHAWLPQRHEPLRAFVREEAATSLLNRAVIDLVLNDPSLGGGKLVRHRRSARPWRNVWPRKSWTSMPSMASSTAWTCQCNLMPGKRLQASLCTGPRPYGTPHSRIDDANLCTPILSQPVVEAALRIPTWLQFENRGERAVLRNAFADLLSPETVRRRSKGGAEILARRILNRNMAFIRERLLDGLLVREQIVDRKRLGAALSDRPAPGSIATGQIFDLLGAELWLARWLRN